MGHFVGTQNGTPGEKSLKLVCDTKLFRISLMLTYLNSLCKNYFLQIGHFVGLGTFKSISYN